MGEVMEINLSELTEEERMERLAWLGRHGYKFDVEAIPITFKFIAARLQEADGATYEELKLILREIVRGDNIDGTPEGPQMPILTILEEDGQVAYKMRWG